MLEAAAMALAAMSPDVITKRRLESEGRILPFIVVGGLDALREINRKIFQVEVSKCLVSHYIHIV